LDKVNKVGRFALVEAFTPLENQLITIKSWGFTNADITDNSDGKCLGAAYGFTSLERFDANLFDLKRMFDNA
jgi:inosose dehydratase